MNIYNMPEYPLIHLQAIHICIRMPWVCIRDTIPSKSQCSSLLSLMEYNHEILDPVTVLSHMLIMSLG